MNLLNKLTIKNLKLNKKRTIVTIIGIMLSVALLTALSSLYTSFIASLIRFETYQRGNYHVVFYDVDKKDIGLFENNLAIDECFLTKNIGYAKIEESKNESKPYAFVKAFNEKSFDNLAIRVVEGRLPKNSDEIIIPTHLKTNGRVTLKVGDEITLDIGTRIGLDDAILEQHNPFQGKYDEEKKEGERIINTTSKTYKIVGIMERPDSSIESYSAPGYTFITYLDKIDEKVDVFARYTKDGAKRYKEVTANILGIKLTTFRHVYLGELPGLDEEDLKEDYQNAKYKIGINNYLILLETNPFDDGAVGGLGSVVVIVTIIIIVSSIFCIKNSFDISITEKIKQYGMLRSVGATKRQIKKNVFYEASILGIIGIPLGIICGLLASYILIIISNYYIKDMLYDGLKLIYGFSFTPILVAIILGSLTIYLSALRSAHKASKVSPITSIRNSANIKIKAKQVRSPKLIKKIFGIGGTISYKNIKRNKKKYRTTIISLVTSVSVFIALNYFMNLAFSTFDGMLSVSDYNLSLSAIVDYESEAYDKVIESTNLDNINDYTIYRYLDIRLNNPKYNKQYLEALDEKESDITSIRLIAIGDEQYQKYLKELNIDIDDKEGILLDTIKFSVMGDNDKIIKYRLHKFNYHKGDNLKLYIDNFDDKIKFNMKIGYITDVIPFGLSETFENTMEPSLLVSDKYFDELTHDYFVNKPIMFNIFFDTDNADKLQDDLDTYLNGVDHYSINNIAENVRMMNSLYTLLGIFLYGFIIVITLIGITNIFNTITTNMELRRQEFAMLKSIGMTKKEFSRMIRLESMFIGFKSLFFGITIGCILSYLIFKALGDNTMTFKLPFMAILLATLGVLLLITCLMRYSMNKINKQNTIETIRNENI